MTDKTVVLEFCVDGLPLHGSDNIFHADTDMTKKEWDSLSDDEQEAEARILFREQVQYGWHEHEEEE